MRQTHFNCPLESTQKLSHICTALDRGSRNIGYYPYQCARDKSYMALLPVSLQMNSERPQPITGPSACLQCLTSRGCRLGTFPLLPQCRYSHVRPRRSISLTACLQCLNSEGFDFNFLSGSDLMMAPFRI